MEIFVIKHNIKEFLPKWKDWVERRFSDLRKANDVFESLSDRADYSNDECISLEVVEMMDVDGEWFEHKLAMLRLFSDDTKIGVKFNPGDYE
ncbi:MAG: hypothetical protein HDS62_08390 [Bacteroidales bacterium]|nr:hypothetical protein [Bacteroidales bacterium]